MKRRQIHLDALQANEHVRLMIYEDVNLRVRNAVTQLLLPYKKYS